MTPSKQHHGARARVAHRGGHGREIERLAGDLHQPDRARSPADRRDQRDLLVGAHGRVGGRVLAVERDDALPGLQAHRGEHVGRARVVGQVELDVIAARALAQAGEEPYGDLHTVDATSSSASSSTAGSGWARWKPWT